MKQDSDDVQTHRECSQPIESREAADVVVQSFYDELRVLRRKYKIANVLCTIKSSVLLSRDNGEVAVGEFAIPLFIGDSSQAEGMAAYAYGVEQAQRQERIQTAIRGGGAVITTPARKR